MSSDLYMSPVCAHVHTHRRTYRSKVHNRARELCSDFPIAVKQGHPHTHTPYTYTLKNNNISDHGEGVVGYLHNMYEVLGLISCTKTTRQ